jgi:hypothetical protein
MNFDACGANTAALEDALSNAERKLSQVELCGYSDTYIFTKIWRKQPKNMYI